jgi:hypothetical protein
MIDQQPPPFPTLTPHALARIAERFGVMGEADAWLWVLRQMYCARVISRLERGYRGDQALWWVTKDTVIITRGNEVRTAFAVTPEERSWVLYGLTSPMVGPWAEDEAAADAETGGAA